MKKKGGGNASIRQLSETRTKQFKMDILNELLQAYKGIQKFFTPLLINDYRWIFQLKWWFYNQLQCHLSLSLAGAPPRQVILAGLPRAWSARGTEPHTHRLWSTSFPLVVTWLTERTYVRTYASTDCTGGVGETIKRKGGVSQACLAKSTSFTLDIHNMVNWQLSKQDSHWPVSHDHIAGSCVNSLRWRDLFGSCPLTS